MLQPFSIENAFNINQFDGYDRLNNANQFTLGVSSTLLNNAMIDFNGLGRVGTTSISIL